MALSQYPFKGGIPTGIDTTRPSSPAIGDVFYNGQGGILEIYTTSGWQPCSAPSGIPIITVTDVANRTYTEGPAINVVFTASTNGGFPLGFTGIATSAVTASVYTGSVLSPGTSVVIPTFSGATGYGASYMVTGTSYNGFGTSPYSPGTSVTVTTKPQAPTIGTATASNTTSDVVVTWTNNATGGKNFTAIKINAYVSGSLSTTQTAATTSSTSHAFTGLTAGTTYTFKVFAVNANGDGELSAATNSVAINDVTIEYLVLAGGGGGSSIISGGGGAGGLRTGTGYVKSGTAYTITVGAGGRGGKGYAGDASSEAGYPGWNSVLGSISATGGGGAIGWTGTGTPVDNGQRPWTRNGGSGAGASANSSPLGGTGGTAGTGNLGGYTPVEGYSGGPGDGDVSGGGLGGGGGGAGGAGIQSVSTTNQRSGGNGAASSITGTSVTYGGGGGGGRRTAINSGPSLGGSGGGGQSMTGGSFSSNQNGESARGGGGGGGNYNGPGSTDQAGGNGGSGIIILKIPNTYTATFSGGVTQNPSVSTSVSGYKIYSITGAGTSDTVTIS